MSVKDIPKAGFGSYSDYLFLDDGVLKVKITSPFILFASIAMSAVLIVLFVPKTLGEGTVVSYVVAFLYGWGPIVIGGLVQWTAASQVRRRLSRMPVHQLRTSARSARFIPWETVSLVSFGPWRRLQIHTEGRNYIMWAYRRRAFETVRGFATSKVGVAPKVLAKKGREPKTIRDVLPKGMITAGAVLFGAGFVLALVAPPTWYTAVVFFGGMVVLFSGIAAQALLDRTIGRLVRIATWIGITVFYIGFLSLMLLLTLSGPSSQFVYAGFASLVGVLILVTVSMRSAWSEVLGRS